jgi:TM2 domain-containing membrane protein YozV
LIPLLSAVGITLIVVGTTLTLILSVIGVIIFLITTVIWIRDTRRDIAQLPDEHH